MTLPHNETAAIPQPRSGAHDDLPVRTGALDVLVSVGTDKHRFDRLMGWLEQWWAAQPVPPRLVVQHGSSRPPALPGATPFLAHDQLNEAMAQARVVVTHGGPASITEARRWGHRPIVVARDPAHGEHVDDHQMLFAARMASTGIIRLCATADELTAALHEALTGPPTRDATGSAAQAAAARMAAVARVGQIVDGLVAPASSRSPTGQDPSSSPRPRRFPWRRG